METWQTNKVAWTHSEDLDQPGHPAQSDQSFCRALIE